VIVSEEPFRFRRPLIVEALDVVLGRFGASGDALPAFVLPLSLVTAECPFNFGVLFSDATDLRAITPFWVLFVDTDATEERSEVVDVDLLAFRFTGSTGGTGGRLIFDAEDAVEFIDCRDGWAFGVEGLLILRLALDTTEADDVLRERDTERSDSAVLNVELSVVVDKVEVGREALEGGRNVDRPTGAAAFRKVDACERTDTKEEADDLGLSPLVDAVLVEIVLRRDVAVAPGDLGPMGLVKVTFVLGTARVEAELRPAWLPSAMLRCVAGVGVGTLGVSFESGRGPGGS